MNKLNLQLADTLRKYGAKEFTACYNCGTCTAICNLTDSSSYFPRKIVRYSALGYEKALESSSEPWLCYYCGECNESCPKQAEPAELMMSIRRYLTARYDWTGLSHKLYTSTAWEIGSIVFLALIILLLFVFYHGPMTTELTPQGGVKLNTFAPWKTIELGDWLMAGMLSFFLLTNIFRMYLKIIRQDKSLHIPLVLYFTEAWRIVTNFFTQWHFSECTSIESGKKISFSAYWIIHWFLMTSYLVMFTMIVVFLGWFQTETIYAWWHPQRILGYYATIGLTVGIVYFFWARVKKNQEKTRHSHITDWTFLVLLFLTTITGILVHIFRINGWPMATYYIYVFHIMVLFPMLMIEVPFSKWSHLAYRPFAIYFSNVVNTAEKKKRS
ncbi:MAG: 4Fe-4S ferredoxin [Bacteroidetes bacterium]|nr:MAG: 4Fe-4S ferredoxin [Bacteroidota bacterium]